MFGAIAQRFFGTTSNRLLKKFNAQVTAINDIEHEFQILSDDELRDRTSLLRDFLLKGKTENDILIEAFAIVREAAKRTLGQRHFDSQLLGGLVLHKGMIAEMRTGEGKTLVSTLAAYLNAISGNGVHIVTVNDYLSKRDSEWMGQVFRFLGLSVGVIVHDLNDVDRKKAYSSDITYGTNNEFGFDYLRDNMKFRFEEMVQRSFNFAIVDEVDSILIDESRTPLIISGPTEDNSDLYLKINRLIPQLLFEDFEKDEKIRAVTLTEAGVEHIESLLIDAGFLNNGNLYDIQNINLVHHVNQALRAHKLFTNDVDYIVKDNKVVIVDEFTGRMMEGRRYSEGLHQALEAKESVAIQNENQTLASITFQNYFRLYPKLSGMTGTAMTEASEFSEIYNLNVVDIPTNLPVLRKDADDEIYRTKDEKFDAIVNLICDCYKRRQPVLVGTVSIEKSEILSKFLKKKKVPHEILNARHHEREAYIVSLAGIPGAVTIATNMAGRGTDIQLGGNLDMRIRHELDTVNNEIERTNKTEIIKLEVEKAKKEALAAGGLFVIGTERHESRRIDNQLRGRSGRQGDPGISKFFLSLEDDLMRIFGSQRMDGVLLKLGLKQGEAIVHPWINKAIEKAQQKIEARNFDVRKNLLKFDDVMNDQRKVIYEQRKELINTTEISQAIVDMRHETVKSVIVKSVPPQTFSEQWDIIGLHEEILRIFGINLLISEWSNEDNIDDHEIYRRIIEATDSKMEEKTSNYGSDIMRMVEKNLLLQLLDQSWKDHLLTLDYLRQGINLRAYGHFDPLNEYKREAFNLFDEMLVQLREKITSVLFHVELRIEHDVNKILTEHPSNKYIESHNDPNYNKQNLKYVSDNMNAIMHRHVYAAKIINQEDSSSWFKTSRNAMCPCGSGKKYKHCHGAIK
ncbi:MAG: preprotein translocase subunit SecA [Rhodospirillaceae bacterium]|jgi:preprotein translocase subunit SecA|nr:preprotein translocase subunit SecA [Rhodospirillaceae bacterium]